MCPADFGRVVIGQNRPPVIGDDNVHDVLLLGCFRQQLLQPEASASHAHHAHHARSCPCLEGPDQGGSFLREQPDHVLFLLVEIEKGPEKKNRDKKGQSAKNNPGRDSEEEWSLGSIHGYFLPSWILSLSNKYPV